MKSSLLPLRHRFLAVPRGLLIPSTALPQSEPRSPGKASQE